MQTQQEILDRTRAQLALDMSCTVADMQTDQPVVGPCLLLPGRRLYRTDGCMLHMMNWNDKTVAAAQPAFLPWCRAHVPRITARWMFEYPMLAQIDRALQPLGHTLDDIHQYFLPDVSCARTVPRFPVVWYERADIEPFRGDDRFSEAFAFDPSHPDVLAVSAMDGDTVMGMAGASADGEDMWQIGIDVLPAYRGRGVAENLTALLKDEILSRGKIPFYGTCPSHIVSLRTARSAGFFPAWAELFSGQRTGGTGCD